MSLQPPGRGRRSNGLDARGWVALVDIDPRLAETVLDMLSTAGIAAYVEPSPGAIGSYLEVRLPATPTDRLFVDPVHRQQAQSLTDQALAEHAQLLAQDAPDPTTGGSPEEEAVWADLVARLTGPEADEVPPWPVVEDVQDPPTPRGRVLRRRSDPDRPDPDQNDASRWLDPAEPDWDNPAATSADVETGGPDDEHYVPPTPPPVGRVTRATAISLVGFAVGLLLIIEPGWIGLVSSDGTFAVGLLVMLAAFGWLVYRLSDGPPLDSGPDDGAVV